MQAKTTIDYVGDIFELITLAVDLVEMERFVPKPFADSVIGGRGRVMQTNGLRKRVTRRVLVVEDHSNWQKILTDSLREIAEKCDCDMHIDYAKDYAVASDRISEGCYHCVIVDNKLPDGVVGLSVVDKISRCRPAVSIVVVSGVATPQEVRDFLKDYPVCDFFSKQDFKPMNFRTRMIEILELCPEHELITGGSIMDWNTVVSIAISVVSPYAVAFGTSAAAEAGKAVVKTASEGISSGVKKLLQWIRQTVESSGTSSDKEVLENFAQNPKDNQQLLEQVIKRINPIGDDVLRGYVEGLVRQVEIKKAAELTSLLSNPQHFMFNDLKRICSGIDPNWEGEVGEQTQERLARWVILRATTRKDLPKLIGLMLHENPRVVLE